jgi:hypothetical protein
MMKQKSYWHHTGSAIRNVNSIILITLLLLIVACKSDKLHWSTKRENTLEFIPEVDSVLILEGISKNPNYGYSPQYPIKLGVTNEYTSATYPEKYLQSITGPNGEQITYERIKSCCFFKTVNSDAAYQNVGVLEVYEVTYSGLKTPKILYLNFFDQGAVFAPQGFIPKKVSANR